MTIFKGFIREPASLVDSTSSNNFRRILDHVLSHDSNDKPDLEPNTGHVISGATCDCIRYLNNSLNTDVAISTFYNYVYNISKIEL